MRFLLTFTLILTFETIFSQDSCFLHRIPSIDDFVMDTAHRLAKTMDEYVNSFNGCNAPQFTATTIGGKKISSEQLKGKVVVINFWFTHCKPCVGEFPSLNKLADEFAARGVEFVSFALDSAKVLDSFLITHPLKYEVVAAAQGYSELFRIWPYPTNLILGKDYRVIKSFRGGTVNPDEALKNYGLIKPFIEAALAR